MRTTILILLLLARSASESVLLAQDSLALRADQTEIDRLAAAAMTAWHAPALEIAVVQKDQPAILQAYGLRELSGSAATIDDVFPIASCTKAFTTALLASLAKEGKLRWDDPVRTHLPSFHLSEPHADALVSLRDLLAHRTGVNGHDLLWYHSKLSNEELLQRAAKLPLTEPFRGAYQYNTLMYLAAGQAAANAAGKPWHEAVKERLTGPLSMSSVTFTTSDPAFVAAPKLSGHRLAKDGSVERMARYEIPAPNPAGSIQLNLRDLERWLRYQLNAKGHLKQTHEPQIVIPLSPAQRRYQSETVQVSYGLGWIVSDYRGHRLVSHGGMIDGFRTVIVLAPDDGLALAIVANLHETKLNGALANSLLDLLLKLPPKDWNAIHANAVTAEKAEREAAWQKITEASKSLAPLALPLADYAGEYANDAYGSGQIVLKDGVLVWEWSSFRTPLSYWGDEAFFGTEGVLDRMPVEFQTVQGKVKALRFQGQVFDRRP